MTISKPIRWGIALAIPILCLAAIGVATADGDAGASANTAAPEASVLVSTVTPRRGAIPDIVTAYGAATPGANATRNIVLRREVEIGDVAVEAGQSVHSGDVLAEVATTPTAAANYRQAVTALALAAAQHLHTEQLRSQRLATKDQLAQAAKAEADARAQLEALKRDGADRSTETIKSPCDGAVSMVAVAPGDRLQANAPLFTLGCGGGAVIVAGLEPDDEARVSVGQKVRLEPLSQAVGTGTGGVVAAVGGMIDQKTHMVPTIVRTPARMLAGANYRALITVGDIAGWLVPRDAVLSDALGAYVFEIDGNKAHRVEVQQTGTQGDTICVSGALDASRPIVTSGNYQLDDGMAVRVVATGANR